MSTRRRMMMMVGAKKTQVKKLPLQSKLKFSSGKTFVLQAKGLGGHPTNSVTFISEYIIENARWSNGEDKVSYTSSNLNRSKLPSYYNALSALEKSKILSYSSYGNMWLPSMSEVNNMNFPNNESRIKKIKNGSAGQWMTRDYSNSIGSSHKDGDPYPGIGGQMIQKYVRGTYQDITCITTTGEFKGVGLYSGEEMSFSHSPSWMLDYGGYSQSGVVPCCDIDGDAWVTLDKSVDAYWHIVEK